MTISDYQPKRFVPSGHSREGYDGRDYGAEIGAMAPPEKCGSVGKRDFVT